VREEHHQLGSLLIILSASHHALVFTHTLTLALFPVAFAIPFPFTLAVLVWGRAPERPAERG
jgi:hypothetical protein